MEAKMGEYLKVIGFGGDPAFPAGLALVAGWIYEGNSKIRTEAFVAFRVEGRYSASDYRIVEGSLGGREEPFTDHEMRNQIIESVKAIIQIRHDATSDMKTALPERYYGLYDLSEFRKVWDSSEADPIKVTVRRESKSTGIRQEFK
jgi:hypothetical protein